MLLVFLGLCLSLAFIQGYAGIGPGPELNLATDDITLLTNGTLELECAGYFNLKWIFPAHWRSLIASKATVVESYEVNQTKPYVSKLKIEDLEYRFTGRYICASTVGPPVNEEDYQDSYVSTSVYVYVYGYAGIGPGPELNLATDDITLLTNGTLELECAGYFNLKWIFPADWRSLIASKATVVESYEVNQTKPYVSKLKIEDLEYRFTGRYICASTVGPPVNEEDYQDSYVSTSVYVYVYDEDRLLVPMNNKSLLIDLFNVYSSRTLTIPCRPTRPEIKVELVSDSNGIKGYEYDPRRGFFFAQPLSHLHGKFECHATYGNLKENKIFVLQFTTESTIDPHPRIDPSGAEHPAVNKPFILDCIVYKDQYTLVNVFWIYPPGAEDVELKNMTMSPYVLQSDEKATRISAKLEVAKATKNHTGTYTCISITARNKFTDTIFIQVQDQIPEPYVNLSSHVTTPLRVNVSTVIKLVVKYDYHQYPSGSTDPHTEWKKDGINLEKSARITSTTKENQIIFKIDPTEIDDTGNYTLFVRLGGSAGPTANWTVAIFVKSAPQVKIVHEQTFFEKGKRFTLRCDSKGYPQAKVWWLWSPCISYQHNCNHQWTDVDPQSTTSRLPNSAGVTSQLITSSYRSSRNLTVIAMVPGTYLCKASNYIGRTNKSIPFAVTEDLHGHWMSDPKPTPIEGHIVKIMCRASKQFYYTLAWSVPGKGPINNGTNNIVIVETENDYSLLSTLTFQPLTLNHSQLYRCTAKPFGDGFQPGMFEKNLTVFGQSAPQFLNDTLPSIVPYQLPTSDTVRFSCDHKLGMPPPAIRWLKNGNDNFHRNGIEEKNSSLVITRVMTEDEGLYTCQVFNSAGFLSRNFSLTVIPVPEAADTSQWIYIGIALGVGPLLIILITVLLCKIRKEKIIQKEQEFMEKYLFDNGQMNMFNPDLPLDEQVNLLPYNQKWEFPRDRLRLGRVIGQGAFGRVVKAEAIGLDDSETHTTVAVKMLKERADSGQLNALMAELKILIHLGSHLNILNLLGATTKNMAKGELLVIVEYCRFGNIRNYLLRYRSRFKDQLDPLTGKVDTSQTIGTDEEDYLCPRDPQIGNGFSNPNYQGPGGTAGVKLNYAHLQHSQSTGSEAATSYPVSPTSPTSINTNPWDSAMYSTSSGTVNFRSRLASEATTLSRKTLCTSDLLCFAFQCARGMEYLASRKLIHRDLAARNVLLAEGNIVKICDFGLAKDCYKDDAYVKKNDGPLPIKWMAIESIGDKVFTTRSDVWSFGVLLWEFFTLGSNPYPGIELDEDFYRKLKCGYRMEKPRYAPDDVYNLMSNCWHEDPLQRPTFDFLAQTLGDTLEAGVRQYYVDLNTPYMEMNVRNQPAVDYLSMGTQGEGTNYLNMETDPCTAHYDNVTNVRPVEGEGPAPLQPLEVVPMIQLEPVVLTEVKRNKSFRKALAPPGTSPELERAPERTETPVVNQESHLLDRYPSTEDDEDVASVVFELNTSLDKSNDDYMTMGKVNNLERSRKGNESLRSAASSGFHSDLDAPEGLSPPPPYTLVMDNVA